MLRRHLAASLAALGWIWSSEAGLSTLCYFWAVFVGTQVEMQAEKETKLVGRWAWAGGQPETVARCSGMEGADSAWGWQCQLNNSNVP